MVKPPALAVDSPTPRIHEFHPNLLAAPTAFLPWLVGEVVWQEEVIRMFGKHIKVPRQVAWFGDAGLNYRYSGKPHIAQGWPPLLQGLRDDLQAKLGVRSNFVLLNRYRSGSDYMGWHKDDELSLVGPVVSVSIGATRRFSIEEPVEKHSGFTPSQASLFRLDQPSASQSRSNGRVRHTYELENGSVLVHPGAWRHTLPKTVKPVGERFNLSFRQLRTDA